MTPDEPTRAQGIEERCQHDRDTLIALRTQPPRVAAAEAQRIARDLYGLDATAHPLTSERDCTFRLEAADSQQFVLKLIDPDADESIVAAQSAVLAHLAEQAPTLPVPRIRATLDGASAGIAETTSGTLRVRLTTYLSGIPVFDVKPTAELLHALGQQMAHLDRALRGFFSPALAQPIAWDIRHAPALQSRAEHLLPASARRLTALALDPIPGLLPGFRGLPSQPIHGDCHPRNLLTDAAASTGVGIIDFGDVIHAPLAFEPAVAMAEFLMDGIAELDAVCAILMGYTSVQPLQPNEVSLLYDIATARMAVTILIQNWRAHHQASTSDTTSGADKGALRALDQLFSRGRQAVTSQWLRTAAPSVATVRRPACTGAISTTTATSPPGLPGGGSAQPADRILRAAPPPTEDIQPLLQRRHRALGAHAELSYDQPLHLVRGDGVWLYSASSERYLDVYNNVPHVGHAHPTVVAAIADQASRLASNTRYLDERIISYVERLTATLPPGLDTCLFVNSGSEANDIAWRIAKAHTGRAGALVMEYAYHGITDAVTELSPALCRTSPTHVEQLAAPCIGPDMGDRARSNAEAALARLGSRGFGLAALLIDSALTSTGIYDPAPGWVEPIVTAVRSAGGLIIGDEVQYGLGRSGSDFWGFARRGYVPDIVTLGKPVGNGYPLGVVITRRSILEPFQKATGFFSTFGGNPVAAAAGLAVLDVLATEHLMENARSTGDYFRAQLSALAKSHAALKQVRGAGLLIGIEIADLPNESSPALTRKIVNGLRQRGVLIGSEGPHGNVLKLRPPMPFRPEHADQVVDALRSVLTSGGATPTRPASSPAT